MGDRFLKCRAAQRLVSRLAPPLYCEIIEAGFREMSGDHLGLSGRALGVVAQEFGGALVQGAPAALQKAFVCGVLDQDVFEAIVRLGSIALDEKDVGLGEALQTRSEFGFFKVGDGLQKCEREVAPEHGADLSDLPSGPKPVEPSGERLLQSW